MLDMIVGGLRVSYLLEEVLLQNTFYLLYLVIVLFVCWSKIICSLVLCRFSFKIVWTPFSICRR